MPALFFFGESYCTVVCLDPRVNDATGSARLVRRRTLDYVQDSDPKHTAKLTQDWLRTHVPEYITAAQQWAPRSPDLNPIENIWALVARRASLRQPRTLEALKRAVRGAWNVVMTEECCITMADSMEARLAKLRKVRGAHTGY